MKNDTKDHSYVAMLTVTSSLGTETVYSLDKAWRRLRELPRPARSHFIQYVRSD